ncbi:MAG: hypothetical protein ACTHKU_11730 [Verrucomicrobiota bacterium]
MHGPTRQYPPFPDQSKRIEDPDKARVYLIRPEKGLNSGVGFIFYGSDPVANGPRFDPRSQGPAVPLLGIFPPNVMPQTPQRLIGEVAAGAYLCWEESPHCFITRTIQGQTNLLSIDLQAGHVYYLRASIPGFWRPECTVEQISEEEGQRMLTKSRPPDDYRTQLRN